MRVTGIVVMMLGLVSVTGCGLFVPPEAKAEMKRLETVMVKSTEQGKRIADEIAELKEKQEAGELTMADATQKLPTLIAEGKEAFANFKEARESLTALREEHDLPWWQIALGGGAAILSALFGGGGLLVARKARQGVGVLADAIERSDTVKDVKTRAAKAMNPEINRAAYLAERRVA